MTVIDPKASPTLLTGEQISQQFSRELLSNEKALEYVNERGIKKELIEQGRMGFCPPYSRHWFPLLKGRIIVPIRDVHGTIIAFAGRKYEAMQELTHNALWDAFGHEPAQAKDKIDKWNKGKWINEPYPKQRHLFNLYEGKEIIRKRNYINLVEGYLDALVLSSKNMGNTAAICGTALSQYHVALIKRYCDHVVLMLDADDAGEQAVIRSKPIIEEADLKLHVVYLPKGYDPDEFVLKYGSKQLRLGIEQMIVDNTEELKIKVA